jgi:hypothetical protein
MPDILSFEDPEIADKIGTDVPTFDGITRPHGFGEPSREISMVQPARTESLGYASIDDFVLLGGIVAIQRRAL